GTIRKRLGLGETSHRLCFGEVDGIPGLIIDRYLSAEGSQVFVLQAQTAGANLLMGDIVSLVKDASSILYPAISWERTAIICRNNSEMRRLEGIDLEEPAVLKDSHANPQEATLLVRSRALGEEVKFRADLLTG